MLAEVEVAAVRNALELLPADREQVLDVGGRDRVVGQLGGVVCADAHMDWRRPSSRCQLRPLLDPVLVPRRAVGRRHEELHLHLLELARAEEEVARRDLVAEALADLRDAERRLHAHRRDHVLEVDEDALRRLGTQIRARRVVGERSDVRLEHQVELRGSVRSHS